MSFYVHFASSEACHIEDTVSPFAPFAVAAGFSTLMFVLYTAGFCDSAMRSAPSLFEYGRRRRPRSKEIHPKSFGTENKVSVLSGVFLDVGRSQ